MEKTESGKVKVVGVRFRTAGKIYYFDPCEFELARGCHVIVETARGIEYGFVVGNPMEVEEKDIQAPLKPVLRISTPEDDERVKKNRERERERTLRDACADQPGLENLADKPKDARERRERPDGENIFNGARPLAHFASLHSLGDSLQPL